MTALLTAVTDVFTAAVGWVSTVATTITGQPVLLLFCVAVPLCGLGVGMFSRLTKTKPGPTPWRGRALSLIGG